MGRRFEEVRQEMELTDEFERGIHTPRHLSEEVRDMRNAGRKLEATEEEDVTLAGLVQRMHELENEQKKNNKQLVDSMNQLLIQMREILDEVEYVRTQARDEEHLAQQAALNGVNRAQQQAEQNAIRSIERVTKKSEKYIDSMVQVAKRRIERLALVTLPDRLFQALKWVVLTLLLFILSHVAWQLIV